VIARPSVAAQCLQQKFTGETPAATAGPKLDADSRRPSCRGLAPTRRRLNSRRSRTSPDCP
jgi:hypothetical protein